MSRTLKEIKVKYVRPVAATRTWEEISDKLYVTEDTSATAYDIAQILGLPSAEYVDEYKARKVKAVWNMSDIIKKAKLTESEEEAPTLTAADIANAVGLPSADFVDDFKARKVKAVWNLSDIIKKAKLTEITEAAQ